MAFPLYKTLSLLTALTFAPVLQRCLPAQSHLPFYILIMKQLFIVFLLTLITPYLHSQDNNSIIKGKVTHEGKPVAFVTALAGKTATQTDENGDYLLQLSVPGKTVLQFSSVGYETTVKSLTLQPGETRIIDVSLVISGETLQSVEIIGRKETTYKNTNSFIGTRTATPLKDVPQAITYVTKELMMDQQAMRVGEIVKNMSGVNQYTFYDDITIRGFRVAGGQTATQLVNGMRTITGFWKQSLTNYLERVEVIKGPASALYGNASPGGTLNRVTKKPLTENRQSISFTTGSFNTLRANADFTGPMNESRTLLYRLNLGYENSQTFRDLQFDKNIVVAPSISFLPTERTRINFDLVVNQSNSRLDRGQPVFGNGDIYTVPISRSLSMVNDHLNETNLMITTSLTHQFTENFQFNIGYLKTGWEEDLLEHRSANTYAKDSSGNIIPTLVEMQVFDRKRKMFADNVSAYFNWNVSTGKIGHKLVFGYDYAQAKTPWGASQLGASGYRNNTNTGASAYNPAQPSRFLYETVNGIKRPVANVPHFDLTATSPYQIMDMSKYFYTKSAFDPTFYSVNGIYLQDQVKLGRFNALIGLRYDKYADKVNYLKSNQQTVKQDAFIPRLGLVYEVRKNINVYATWAKGYMPQTAASISNPNAGGPFDPQYSELMEVGTKSEWFDHRLSLTASVYQIRLENVLYNAGVPGQPDLLRQVGEVTAKGAEFEVTGSIASNWSLIATYSYNDAAITESLKKEEIGVAQPNAPKHQGSFWTKYSIIRGKLSGIGFGLGGNFVTERNTDITKLEQTLPAYALLNGAIYYRVNKFQVQFNLNNILNKTHWVGGYDYLRLFPGAPRNWLATVGYTF